MERIQSALQKARTARAEQTPGTADRTAPQRPDRPLRTSDVEAAWQALPQIKLDQAHLERNRVTTTQRSQDATPFDIMRTRVFQRMQENNWTRVAITSPSSSCGKTTTCANLALSMARQAERRSILIELDLRRPALGKTLGVKRGQFHIAKALEGDAPIEDNLGRVGDNLILGLNSGVARAPSELLQSNRLRQNLDAIQDAYQPDIMIFDMPPMLVNDDFMAFSSAVDAVLLVAAAETTTSAEVDTCERELSEQTNVLGVILNKCRYMGKEYGYSYY